MSSGVGRAEAFYSLFSLLGMLCVQRFSLLPPQSVRSRRFVISLVTTVLFLLLSTLAKDTGTAIHRLRVTPVSHGAVMR